MVAEQDLPRMLRGMQPVLAQHPFGIVTLADLPAVLVPFATVAEVEGLTVIATQSALAAAGLDGGAHWALISLTLHSDLAAVGLTAAFANALGDEGISANVIAGYYHDHILVQWAQALDAMAALRALAHA
jgi:hypothetical protein